MCGPNRDTPASYWERVEGQVVYVRAVIVKIGDCDQLGISIRQPGKDVHATLVVEASELRRKDMKRLGVRG